MGRLDDQAKHRIVVLRKAGLSFRKIKKVLELDNIKVTPQAIYLFLKRKNIEPEKSVGATQNLPTKGQPWEQAQLWSLLQDNGGQKKETVSQIPNAQQTTSDVKPQDGQKDNIKIVNVMSLSQGNPSLEPPTNAPRTVPQAVPEGQRVQDTRSVTVRPTHHPTLSIARPCPAYQASHNHVNGRARTPLPAPRNPALLVTKKLVDKAIILQKKVIFQNGGQTLNPGGAYPLPATSQQQTARPAAKASAQIKDASTQTALSSFPPTRPEASGEQLDSIRGELHRLTQVMQTLIERQNRWEQEQMRQRQCNHQEVLSQIQQLGAKLFQTCAPFSAGQETEAHLPDFGPFKMELL
ncbi:uncharacterized protein LOC121007401 [Bufo bufo]|uniref:uncharacterized protein LOC121007401 n=1 Tax=Bufo bufo TaxID=8384 RepID=UPI001ABDAD3A|nr:uncharacterized protein LOC121007401 [Bufo bufo]XP_040295234.1 uncharacterized protein LOC121007401 [Bufo bufo]XP_040295235.1 uncharacterized protein LOC121007401 [Bufo bufo]